MKTKIIWLVSSLVVVFVIAVTVVVIKIVPSKRQVAIPQSIESVQSFIDKHSETSNYNDISDIVPEVEVSKNQEVLASSMSIDDKLVQFLTVKLNSKKEAREFFKVCKDRLKGSIQIASINSNTSNYYYWTAIVSGEKIYLWQKDEWVVLIKGDDSDAVKALKHEFEDNM